jgi:hypothetical protein
MRSVAAVLLLVVATGLEAVEPPAGFAPSLPPDVGDVSRWEVVAGEFEATRMRGSYRFYVNPARQAMYQLMRYRVELLDPAPGGARGAAERVAFVRRPGAREPMLIWVREGGGPGGWRALTADTDEYKIEVGMVLGLLAVNRAARAGDSR